MFKERLTYQIKLHPYASTLVVLYTVFWAVVYCLLFNGFTVGQLALDAMFLSIPYSLIALILSLTLKNSGRFFLWLTFIIYIPIIATFLIVLPLL
ncbi:hypothetical protein MgSA37_01006 [Mucilaginibacter gotjawali]|uniref:Uncharacterized protein n=2 Tax=Mucilaginibacter gotjawali TaxID=1550579 RepID=A0A110B166_9SPHI|nr:hypothetical protein [Mucilaginibacter gotjawali]BAU52842.1 hypothetical protein MgSA37_01006 [Mucilaginibacter gotjawali]